jgi:hypothetical protein
VLHRSLAPTSARSCASASKQASRAAPARLWDINLLLVKRHTDNYLIGNLRFEIGSGDMDETLLADLFQEECYFILLRFWTVRVTSSSKVVSNDGLSTRRDSVIRLHQFQGEHADVLFTSR